MIAPDAAANLRGRLVSLRDDALRQLGSADHLDGGMLSLVGNIGSALAAIDVAPSPNAASAVRLVVADDGREITVTLYDTAGAVAAAQISPYAALRLALQLVASATRYLSEAGDDWRNPPP